MVSLASMRLELSSLLDSLESTRFEVNCMLEEILGRDFQVKGELYLTDKQADILRAWAERREQGEPLQYILGKWEFFGLELFVGEGVLIPRQDTEALVERALSFLEGKPKSRILDLCTGSGCIALALAKYCEGSSVTAVELSPQAYSYLEKNTAHHRATIQTLCDNAREPSEKLLLPQWDLITCNPPYINRDDMQALEREVSYEPVMALYGGKDGLTYYREMIPLWKQALKPGGGMLVEVGYGQAKSVATLFHLAGYDTVEITPDYTGINRIVGGFVKGEGESYG